MLLQNVRFFYFLLNRVKCISGSSTVTCTLYFRIYTHVGLGKGHEHTYTRGVWIYTRVGFRDMGLFTRVGLGRGMGHEHIYTRVGLGRGMSKQRFSCSRLERMKHRHFFQLVYCTSCTVIRGSPFTYDLERPISTFLCIYNFHKF